MSKLERAITRTNEILDSYKCTFEEYMKCCGRRDDIEPEDIVMYQDITPLLEAIGADVVGEWLMGLGSV